MRAREVQRAAKQLVAEELGAREFEVICPPTIRAVGVKGDERHRGKVVMVRVQPDQDEPADLFYKRMARVSERLTNEIDDVGRVTLDVTRLRQ